jgi:hypothetical protein
MVIMERMRVVSVTDIIEMGGHVKLQGQACLTFSFGPQNAVSTTPFLKF